MKKRGISPLIATVLIISFTILLGAFVMIWGSDIFNKYIKGTSEEAGVALECSKTSLSIKEACVYGNNVYLSLENTGQTDIASFLTRISGEKGKALNETGDLLGVYSKKIFGLDFSTFNEIGIPEEIEIYPKIIYENKEYTCDYANKKEVKSCFELLGFKEAKEFDVVPKESGGNVMVLSKEKIKEMERLYNIQFQTEMETAPNILLIQSLDESRTITATSKPFTIPDDKRIERIVLYSESFDANVIHKLIGDFDDDIPGDEEIAIGDTITGTGTSRVAKDINIEDIKGKEAKLEINFEGQGYTTVFRFCYSDKSNICIV